MENDENIPLSKEDIQKIKDMLIRSKFEDFEIHSRYWLKGIVVCRDMVLNWKNLI